MVISQLTKHSAIAPALQMLDHLWRTAVNNQLAVAVWRIPGSDIKHLAIDLSGKVQQLKLDVEEAPAGFAISPFVNPAMEHTRFIKADIYYNTSLPADSWQQQVLNTVAPDFFHRTNPPTLQKEAPAATQQLYHYLQTPEWNFTKKQHYTELVQKSIAAIKEGKFEKVVLSRTKEVLLPGGFEVLRMFEKLCNEYKEALISLFYLPNEGIWIGASPEVLVSIDKHQHFHTMSLAGTQAKSLHGTVSDVAWTQKEIEEQAMVSRYIVNCFKKIRLREFEETGPRTVTAGNLMHLRTDFQVDMKATGFPQLGTVMLDLLHPTSAVCGMPKDVTLQFILENEGYNRKFYSGFLGPVNIEASTNLYVNLRCMEIVGGKAVLYAGAGITASSDPEREWNETEIKCQTLLGKIIDTNN